jgi:hypothetical protein
MSCVLYPLGINTVILYNIWICNSLTRIILRITCVCCYATSFCLNEHAYREFFFIYNYQNKANEEFRTTAISYKNFLK